MRRFRPEEDRLLVQLPAGRSPAPLIEAVEQLGGRIDAVDVSQEGDRRTVALDVALPPRRDAAAVVARVADVEGVLEVRWME